MTVTPEAREVNAFDIWQKETSCFHNTKRKWDWVSIITTEQLWRVKKKEGLKLKWQES